MQYYLPPEKKSIISIQVDDSLSRSIPTPAAQVRYYLLSSDYSLFHTLPIQTPISCSIKDIDSRLRSKIENEKISSSSFLIPFSSIHSDVCSYFLFCHWSEDQILSYDILGRYEKNSVGIRNERQSEALVFPFFFLLFFLFLGHSTGLSTNSIGNDLYIQHPTDSSLYSLCCYFSSFDSRVYQSDSECSR